MTERFRDLGVDDAAWLASLDLVLFGAESWSESLFRDELSQPNRAWVALESEGVTVGYGGTMLDPFADILSIGVFPDQQGRGYGRRILGELIARAWAAGRNEIFLEVRVDNTVAITMYGTAGFVEISRRPKFYQPSGLDAIVMRLERA